MSKAFTQVPQLRVLVDNIALRSTLLKRWKDQGIFTIGRKLKLFIDSTCRALGAFVASVRLGGMQSAVGYMQALCIFFSHLYKPSFIQ